MNPESRRIIHLGINFIMVPPPLINQRTHLGLQEALIAQSIEFSQVALQENEIEVVRAKPTPLMIKAVAPAGQPTGQLLIVAPNPARPLQVFIQESEFIVQAFEATWPTPKTQIVKRDVTIRDLYETDGHAFRELWETRLGQPKDSLSVFGGPVLGGGLRFVRPRQPDRPAQIEVKSESYLRDTRKVFIETQFSWLEPTPSGVSFDPRKQLTKVDHYARTKVLSFAMGEDDLLERAEDEIRQMLCL